MRVVQHAAGLQVIDQGGGRPVHAGPHVAMVFGDVFVTIPVAARKAIVGAAPNLHEADAPFQQPAGKQAIAAEIFGHFLVEPVACRVAAVSLRNVEHFGCAELQPRRQFVGGDARFQPGVALRGWPGAGDSTA